MRPYSVCRMFYFSIWPLCKHFQFQIRFMMLFCRCIFSIYVFCCALHWTCIWISNRLKCHWPACKHSYIVLWIYNNAWKQYSNVADSSSSENALALIPLEQKLLCVVWWKDRQQKSLIHISLQSNRRRSSRISNGSPTSRSATAANVKVHAAALVHMRHCSATPYRPTKLILSVTWDKYHHHHPSSSSSFI